MKPALFWSTKKKKGGGGTTKQGKKEGFTPPRKRPRERRKIAGLIYKGGERPKKESGPLTFKDVKRKKGR